MITKGKKSGGRVLQASRKRAGRKRTTHRSAVEKATSAKRAAHGMVTFGSVTIKASRVSQNEKQRNIGAGQSALARAKTAIIKRGVKLKVAKGVPLFHVDPDRPNQVVRVINGKREYGVFRAGKFKKNNR